MKKCLILATIMLLTPLLVSAAELKQLGYEVEFEGTFVSAWADDRGLKFELHIRYPRTWRLVDFNREWPGWQGHMKGISATFETPEGAETIFYGMQLRPNWESLIGGGKAPSFEDGIISLTKIKWIKTK